FLEFPSRPQRTPEVRLPPGALPAAERVAILGFGVGRFFALKSTDGMPTTSEQPKPVANSRESTQVPNRLKTSLAGRLRCARTLFGRSCVATLGSCSLAVIC